MKRPADAGVRQCMKSIIVAAVVLIAGGLCSAADAVKAPSSDPEVDRIYQFFAVPRVGGASEPGGVPVDPAEHAEDSRGDGGDSQRAPD